jgi:hypothetical protein
MLTARELNDATSPRIARYRERFRTAAPPEPGIDEWRAWQDLLGDTVPTPGFGPESAMCFAVPTGFATVSSSLLALPAPGRGFKPEWRFASAAGQLSGWEPVKLR